MVPKREVMSVETTYAAQGTSAEHSAALATIEQMNSFFTILFALEMLVKMYAFTPPNRTI